MCKGSVFMAGGEGGFSTKAMGFDKKEVNDYIAKLNQRMKEIETEKKENDEKTQKALKAAQDADAKIKKAADESAKKIADLELQLKTERRNEENLLIQIDDLKRKLKQGGGAAAGGSKAADKAADEIIAKANATAKSIVDKANATAKETVEKAKATATQMVSQAGASAGAGGADPAKLDEFMKVLSAFTEKVTSGVNEVNKKASELLGAKSAAPVTVPDFSNITAPQAEAPKAEAPKAAAPKPAAPAKESKTSVLSDDLFAMLEEDDAPSASMDDDDDDMITEVQPLDDPSNAPGAVVLEEFDLSGSPLDMDLDLDAPVSEVKPISSKKNEKVDLDLDFEKQMLTQTANNAALRSELDEDILSAVKQQEEAFAVKPTDEGVGGLSMESEDEDPLTAMLKQAELTFGGATGRPSEEENEVEESEPASSSSADSANPWAALQDELMAMEKSGDLGSADIETDTGAAESAAAPSADDANIWDFGDSSTSSSDDDDDMGMSSDLFGNF